MYDVIVVGGGPSGSTVAYLCAKNGLKTLIIDKANFPRDKPCGGALSKKAEKLLDKIGIALPDNLLRNKIFGLRIIKPDESSFIIKNNKPIATLIDRVSFDEYLLNEAVKTGVEFIENSKIVSIEKSDDIITINTTSGHFTCKILIGADGVNGNIAKFASIRNKWGKNQSGLCLVTEIDAENIEKELFHNNLINIFYGDVYGGYAWIFPKENSINIGIGCLRDHNSNLKEKFLEFTKKSLNYTIPEKKILGHLIPAGGLYRPIMNENILLVGDAAGFVDSFGGEGIYYAIRSGHLVASSIIGAMENSNFNITKLSNYEKKCYNDFGDELKISFRLSHLIHSHLNFYLSMLENDKKSQQCLLDIALGKKTYVNFYYGFIRRIPITYIKFKLNL